MTIRGWSWPICNNCRNIGTIGPKTIGPFHTRSVLLSKKGIGKKAAKVSKDPKDYKQPLKQDEWITNFKMFEKQLLQQKSSTAQNLDNREVQTTERKKRKIDLNNYPTFKTRDEFQNFRIVDKGKNKKKPVFIEHMELKSGKAPASNVDSDLMELDSLLTAGQSISPKMRSVIENHITKLKKDASAGITQGSEMEWETDSVTDTLQASPTTNDLDEGTDFNIFEDSLVFQNAKASPELHKLLSDNMSKHFRLKNDPVAFDRLKSDISNEKTKSFQEELLAFVDVCIETGMFNYQVDNLETTEESRVRDVITMINKDGGPIASKYIVKMAFTVLTVYYLGHKQGNRQPWAQVNIEVYNTLIENLAKKGCLKIIDKLYKQITDLKLKPTIHTYAAYLECLGRQKSIPVDAVVSVLENVQKHDFNLEEMLNKLPWFGDSWRFVERAIHEVKPDFLPDTRSYPKGYQQDLLAKLNDVHDQPFVNTHSGVLSTAELQHLAEEQIQFELQSSVKVESIFESQKTKTKARMRSEKKLEKIKKHWRKVLQEAFESNLRMGDHIYHRYGYISVMPYFRLFPVDTYVDIMIEKTLQLAQDHVDFSPQSWSIYNELGNQVYQLYLTRKLQEQNQMAELLEMYKSYIQETNEPMLDRNHREIWLDEDQTGIHMRKFRTWSNRIKKEVGKCLCDLMLSDLKINKNINNETSPQVPVLYKVLRYRAKLTSVFELKPADSLVQLLKSVNVNHLHFTPQSLPLLAPPMPWCNEDFGSDIKRCNPLIRADRIPEMSNEQMYGVLDALNSIGHTAWIANKPLLDIAIRVFNDGGSVELGIPESATALATVTHKSTRNMTPIEKFQYGVEKSKEIKSNKEMYSLWCIELYKLSIANKYRDRVFWFPHNLDFRGRAYTCSPYLSHIGGDLSRSMLLFAKGKPLGPDGLDWLKIHLVNLTGLRKRCSNEERLAFAGEMMSEIEDSADNPLEGRRWWAESEDPWQTLVACMEIMKATRSTDPEKYVCHLPVHQDGSCNGLQHYAALGRDSRGAMSVNLTPQAAPKDVYTNVVELVEQKRQEDATSGVKIAQELEGFVMRKVIKQTIMTTVYGVTQYGARQQIAKKLKDLNFQQEHFSEAALYLTKVTLNSLQEMFTSSKKIQDWLMQCAEVTTGMEHCMEWTSPLGLLVRQTYRKPVVVIDPRSKKKIALERPHKMKQKNAVAPNFVHSLDATHMMLTALFAQRAGIHFVSVHDSFWTHACDVHILNKICREQFLALHEQPVLEDFAENLLSDCGFKQSDLEGKSEGLAQSMMFINTILSNVPQRGDFDLKNVLSSTYFFS